MAEKNTNNPQNPNSTKPEKMPDAFFEDGGDEVWLVPQSKPNKENSKTSPKKDEQKKDIDEKNKKSVSKPKKEKTKKPKTEDDFEQEELEEPNRLTPKKLRQNALRNIKKKRRDKRLRILAVILLTFIGLVFYYAGYVSLAFSLIGDFTDSISVALTSKGEWPQSIALAGYSDSDELAGGIVVTGSTDFMVYSSQGALLRTEQHSYANPCIASGDARFCLYNRGGKQLQIENRSQQLYTYNTENPILLCTMSNNGKLAVLTTNELVILNAANTELLRWIPTQDIVSMAFSPSGNHLAIVCLDTVDGALVSNVYELKVNGNSEYPELIGSCTYGIPLQIQYLSYNEVIVIYDNCTVKYNTKDKTSKIYNYGVNTLHTAKITSKGIVLVFGSENMPQAMQMVILDDELSVISSPVIGEFTENLTCDNNYIYLATNNKMHVYNFEGDLIGTQPIKENILTIVQADMPIIITNTSAYAFKLDEINIIKKEE